MNLKRIARFDITAYDMSNKFCKKDEKCFAVPLHLYACLLNEFQIGN